ncbi:MAG: hypothetical protein GY880_28865 [Planctomycetaceae bacterium]|nr:hypothetical protein [Planctomycetaceae bacterium]
MKNGPRRNFQVFSALDFLAEVTQHIPNKGEHLVRYYGWYSHRQRGMRAKAGSDPKKIPVDRAAIYVDESSDRSPRKGSVICCNWIGGSCKFLQCLQLRRSVRGFDPRRLH